MIDLIKSIRFELALLLVGAFCAAILGVLVGWWIYAAMFGFFTIYIIHVAIKEVKGEPQEIRKGLSD